MKNVIFKMTNSVDRIISRLVIEEENIQWRWIHSKINELIVEIKWTVRKYKINKEKKKGIKKMKRTEGRNGT